MAPRITRDYKKQPPKWQRTRHQHVRRSHKAWRISFFLTLLGLVLFIVWVGIHRPKFRSASIHTKPNNIKTQTAQIAQPPVPQFDFYTSLASNHKSTLQSTSLLQKQQQVAETVSSQLDYELKHHHKN